jgi:hypothetical protein
MRYDWPLRHLNSLTYATKISSHHHLDSPKGQLLGLAGPWLFERHDHQHCARHVQVESPLGYQLLLNSSSHFYLQYFH